MRFSGDAPSGSNMQPWFVDVLAGSALEALKAAVRARIPDNPAGEGAPFAIYPGAMGASRDGHPHVMLLAHERGLGTRARESWAGFHPTVTKLLDLPENRIFYCGMAIGYPDPDAPVNTLVQDRIALDEFASLRLD